MQVPLIHAGLSGRPKPTDQATKADWCRPRAANWLARAEATFVTGIKIAVDGGSAVR